jgi:hypothetical protein
MPAQQACDTALQIVEILTASSNFTALLPEITLIDEAGTLRS